MSAHLFLRFNIGNMLKIFLKLSYYFLETNLSFLHHVSEGRWDGKISRNYRFSEVSLSEVWRNFGKCEFGKFLPVKLGEILGNVYL